MSFAYFRKIAPSILHGSILDYGCNEGVFLSKQDYLFNHNLYTGLDVNFNAISCAKIKFPKAEFLYWDCYNSMYNPTGNKNIRLSLGKKFQNIISYSVFTHTTEEDMLLRLSELFDHCEDNGAIYFSFCDIEDQTTINFFKNKRIQEFGHCDLIEVTDRLYLGNSSVVDNPVDGQLFLTFYQREYLLKILSKYKVKFVSSGLNDYFQTCAIVSK